LKKTQGRKKLKQIFPKTQANKSNTQYFANKNQFSLLQKADLTLKFIQIQVFLLNQA